MYRSVCLNAIKSYVCKITNESNASFQSIRRCAASNDRFNNYEKSINQVLVLGRCGTDAQMRGSETKSVVLFSLATHTNYRPSDSEQFQQKTEWHRISVFRPRLQHKAMEYAKKGRRILVQGKLSYGSIIDSSGMSHQTTSIIAEDIIFLSSNSASNAEIKEEDKVEESLEL